MNAAAPGTVITNMTRELLATDEGKAMVDKNVPMPLNYDSEAVVVARLLLWLTSDENKTPTSPAKPSTAMAVPRRRCEGITSGARSGSRVWRRTLLPTGSEVAQHLRA
ncbi:hypothetical protein [Glutamicibacter nicotianae]|uniref:hypothetical protein n=1 Tax=Glutamicibacter nicotianae TaxID=37929 RepID=UPI0030B831F1|nr:hypothetical protein [Glutamicibacter nicotianae]